MRKLFPFAALLLSTIAHAAPAPADIRTAEGLRDRALKGSGAFEIVESLTTEVGPRLAGTAAEASARDWAVAKMRALGFRNVHVEPFTIPGWVRGAESAEVTAPVPQRLVVTALGYSAATPAQGIDAEVIGFTSMAAFREATPEQVRGRIVFITHRMAATQDGSSYGAFNAIRTRAPALASSLGAAAIVIRSLGTDNHRLPHTGVTIWEAGGPRPPGGSASEGVNARPIPAAAMSVPDSELMERLLARGPVRLHLTLTPRLTGPAPSGNVVGEIPGTEHPEEIVLIGGHLDSWDLGTGAIDDGTGVAVTMAAAKLIADHGPARRTIRIVAWGSEEIGLNGGAAYAKAHGGDRHILASEDDFGGGRAWKLETRVADAALPAVTAMARVLLPLGIPQAGNDGGYESDLGPLAAFGVPVLDFAQDGTGYFALHHTADDTLDKVDRAALDQTTAAYTAMAWMAANGSDSFGPAKAETPR
jgi:carboxypeptidase Q